MRERLRVDPVLASLWVGLAAIVAVFAIGASLAADSTTAEVCSAPASVRVPDVDCTAHHPGDTWVYYRVGQAVPAVGGRPRARRASRPPGTRCPACPTTAGRPGSSRALISAPRGPADQRRPAASGARCPAPRGSGRP